jgi:hypothetical protein
MRRSWSKPELDMKIWLLLSVGVLIVCTVLGAWQQRSSVGHREAWEYCEVQSWAAEQRGKPLAVGAKLQYRFVGKAVVCYDQPNGCKKETVTATYSALDGKVPYNFEINVGEAQQEAVAAALAKLGAEGWRLVEAGPDPAAVLPNTESPAHPVRMILYLERRKP